MMATIPSGIRWTSAGTILAQASGLLRLIVVSTSIDFQSLGYYAIAASLAASIGLLGDSGLRQLYLSRQADVVEPDDASLLSAVWLGGVGIQCLVTLAIVPLGAVYVAILSAKELTVLTMAVAISGCAVISALQNPMTLARERTGDFEPSVKAESIGQITSLLVVCALVRLWPSAWLLIAGQGIAAFVSGLASYILLGLPRHLRFEFHPLPKLLRLGRPFAWISATTYVTASLDKLLIGLMLSPSAAGAFFLAQRFADAPRQLHSSILGRTALPHYAAAIASDGKVGVRNATKHYLAITAVIFVFALSGMFVAQGLHGAGLLGRKWEEVSMILPIMMIGTGCRAACHVLAPALVVLGAVQVEKRLKLAEGVAYLAILPLSIYFWHVIGAAAAFSCIYVISLCRRHAAFSSITTKQVSNGNA